MFADLFDIFLEITLSSSVVIAAILITMPVLHKQYTAKLRYFLWLLIAVRLLLPITISLPQAPIVIEPITNNEVQHGTGNLSEIAINATKPVNNTPTIVNHTKEYEIHWNQIVVSVWIMGMIILFFYNMGGYWVFMKASLRFSKPVKDQELLAVLKEEKNNLNIKEAICFLISEKVDSPMMTGFLRPVLFLPAVQFDTFESRIIIKHELIHYKRRDIWYKLLLTIVQVIHWYNPLVYLMKQRADKDIELVCDSEICNRKDMAFRREYSEIILAAIHKVNKKHVAFSTCFYGGKYMMKERFKNILDTKKKRRGFLPFLFMLVFLCAMGGLVACKKQGDDVIVKDTSPTTITSAPQDVTTSDTNKGEDEQVGDDNTNTDTQNTDTTANGESSLDNADSGTDADAPKNNDDKDSNSDSEDGTGTSDTNATTIVYNNTDYGFRITLPKSWENYTIVEESWEGYFLDESLNNDKITGPEILVRHPLWTSDNPRQDIPVMVFTLDQWNSMQNDEFHIGAAPINPGELGRTSEYVFALPARYNYAFNEGFEEVDDILNGNNFQVTDN